MNMCFVKMTNFYTKLFQRALTVNCNAKALVHTSSQIYASEQSKLKPCLLHLQTCDKPKMPRKVSVIGAAGQVGMATSVTFFMKNICDELVMMDKNEKKLCGEALDMLHGAAFVQCPEITTCTDMKNTACSDVIVLAAGINRKPGQSRLDLLDTNALIFKEIIPKLAKLSPSCIFVVLTNPVDLMTYYTWRYSCFEPNRILGAGCELDSTRFRYYISKRLGISSKSVHGYVVGEHGDSSVPAWSSVSIAGTRLRDIDPCAGTSDDTDNWNDCHTAVVKSGALVNGLKGCTNWAISIVALNLTKAVLTNARTIHCGTVHCKGVHGVESDTFLSLPAVIGSNGSTEILQMNLTDEEQCGVLKGEKILLDIICKKKDKLEG